MPTPACQLSRDTFSRLRPPVPAAHSNAKAAGGIDSKTNSRGGRQFSGERTPKELPKHAAEDEETVARNRDCREDHHPVPLVRRPSGGGREVLRIPIPGFACRQSRRSARGLPEREEG